MFFSLSQDNSFVLISIVVCFIWC